MPIKVACTCGKSFDVADKFAGKRVKCPACSEAVSVAETDSNGLADLLDEVDLTQTSGTSCPECRADLVADAIICVQCGYNVNTGRKMVTKKIADRKSAKAIALAGDKAKSESKKKKQSWLGKMLGRK